MSPKGGLTAKMESELLSYLIWLYLGVLSKGGLTPKVKYGTGNLISKHKSCN